MIGRFALSLPFSHSPYRANSSMIEVFFGRTSMLRLSAFDTSNMQQRGTMCVNRSSKFKRTKARLSTMLRGRRRCYGSLPLAVRSRPGRLSRTSQVETRRRESRVETLEKSTDSGKARPHLPELPLSRASISSSDINSSLLSPFYISSTSPISP